MTDEKEQYKKMTAAPLPGLLLSLSAPAVLSMLITSVYNMTDTYFVSKLGTSAAAAVGVVFSLMAIIQSVGFSLGMGTSSYISRFLGEKDSKSAAEYASSAVVAAALFGSVLMISGLSFLEPFMKLLGSTKTVLPYAKAYAGYILIGAPIMCMVFVLNNILRAEGLAKLSMIGIMTGGILNMLLDPLLIFTFKMGIAGAAAATLIGQGVSFIILIFMFLSGKSILKISPKQASRTPEVYVNIINNGLPTLCRQGLASLASVLLAVKAGIYGDAAIAAVTIATKIYMFVRSFVIGIGQGFQPIAGYNYGAGKYSRVKKTFLFVTVVGTAVCTVWAVVLFFGADYTVALFRKDDRLVVEIGSRVLMFFCTVMPLLAYSTYVNQLLQCLGRSKRATFLASLRQGIFYIPLLMILSAKAGLTG